MSDTVEVDLPEVSASFPQFSGLPKELRLQIWETAYRSLRKHRLISLLDHIPSIDVKIRLPRKPYAPDDRTPLLQACVESRAVVFAILTSSFGPPSEAYQWVGQKTLSSVKAFAEAQGFTGQIVTVARLLEAVLVYYNAHPTKAAQHPQELKLSSPFPRLEPALWFDSKNDYLLIPMSRGKPMRRTLPSYTMCGTLLASKVQRMAIEISRSDWDWTTHPGHAILPRIWSTSLETGEVDFPALDSVKEIILWTREGCELCHFTIAPSSSPLGLKPGQWGFSFDPHEEDLKERFGDRWSNVTWRVIFGQVYDAEKKRHLNVCEHLRDWKPHSSEWWLAKMEVTKGVEGLGQAWRGMVERWETMHVFPGLEAEQANLQLIAAGGEDGEEKIYMGPSFRPL